MVLARHTPDHSDPTAHVGGGQGGDARLNVLLSYGGWRENSWADSLPRLLTPLGVRTLRADSGAQAADLLRKTPDIHVAVVDLRVPMNPRTTDTQVPGEEEGGCRLLEMLGRLTTNPPTIVVKPSRSSRDDQRDLCRALNLGAFAVLDRPVDLELLLETFRRLLKRHYANQWPAG